MTMLATYSTNLHINLMLNSWMRELMLYTLILFLFSLICIVMLALVEQTAVSFVI